MIAPEYFRGKPYSEKDASDIPNKLPEWAKLFPADQIVSEIALTLDFLEAKGIKNVGCFGFCYGVWAIFHAAASAKTQSRFKAGVGFHPSLALEPWVWKGTVSYLRRLFSPFLMLLFSFISFSLRTDLSQSRRGLGFFLAVASLGLAGDPAALASKAKFPQLMLSGGNDPDFVREGGAVIKALLANKETQV